jgi:hypothetical protein
MASGRLTRKSATPGRATLGSPVAGEASKAGKAIQAMLLRLVVDEHFNGRKTYPRWHQARAVTLSET